MLETLIYLSAATPEFDEEEIPSILRTARQNNTANGVTGVLLYAEGDFLQVLEGETAMIDATMARIKRDPRHGGLLEVFRGPIRERSFPRWRMGFRKASAAEGSFPLTRENLRTLAGPNAQQEVLTMLRQFYNAAYRYDAA